MTRKQAFWRSVIRTGLPFIVMWGGVMYFRKSSASDGLGDLIFGSIAFVLVTFVSYWRYRNQPGDPFRNMSRNDDLWSAVLEGAVAILLITTSLHEHALELAIRLALAAGLLIDGGRHLRQAAKIKSAASTNAT